MFCTSTPMREAEIFAVAKAIKESLIEIYPAIKEDASELLL
jgi:hypothetical protein